jgi:hypothetical protein
MVFPLAFIAGAVRGIPMYWRLIDCSFGVAGLIPLSACYRAVEALERMRAGSRRRGMRVDDLKEESLR